MVGWEWLDGGGVAKSSQDYPRHVSIFHGIQHVQNDYDDWSWRAALSLLNSWITA